MKRQIDAESKRPDWAGRLIFGQDNAEISLEKQVGQREEHFGSLDQAWVV